MIRGRLCDETKPETFNQLWTVEEQVMENLSIYFVAVVTYMIVIKTNHVITFN